MSGPLDRSRLERPGAVIAHTVEVKETTGSTNDDATRLASAGASHGTVVISERQESGRGRLGRSWHSPVGLGLLMSVVLRDGLPKHPGLITLSAGVAVARGIERESGLPAKIKWPNDVRLNGRKTAGILAEAADNMSYIILGMGINVNHERAALPDEIKDIATSIREESGREFDRHQVFAAVMEELERALETAAKDGGRLIQEWLSLSEASGKMVRAETPGGVIEGVVRGVREDGALLLDVAGQERAIVAGDVHLLEGAEAD